MTNLANGRRYVGKTVKTVRDRWREHVRAAAKGSPMAMHGAIRKHGAEAFSIEVLSEHETEGEALVAERREISERGTLVPHGYNVCAGGRGAPGVLMSARAKERWRRPGFRERAAGIQRIAKNRPEYKARASAIGKSGVTAESRAKQSAAARAQWSDPVEKARRVEAIRATRTPEMIETIRVRHAANFKTPEMQTKLRAAARQRCHGPEGAARRAAQKARPCRKCGGRRVQLANGKMRCRPCHAAREREKRAVIAA